MTKTSHETLAAALTQDGRLFWGEDGAEWRILTPTNDGSIADVFCGPVVVFAENGYGDYLFLKALPKGTVDETVYVYFHETQDIQQWKDSLGILLGKDECEPSADAYPVAVYQSGEPVQIGDRVHFKTWFFFWKGWIEGTVDYVPGLSKRKNKHEYEGLKWINIQGETMTVGCLVDPTTGIVKQVKLLSRAG
ncbi:hypothetical protein [Desulfogranum japonicum]|uniref:hypothetical protein n=1 Tax=Desulfogranum japonicum TaxID=231447 RepID=UPI0003FE7281|nr:hypothetical protein [Desulfogranum japonicum]